MCDRGETTRVMLGSGTEEEENRDGEDKREEPETTRAARCGAWIRDAIVSRNRSRSGVPQRAAAQDGTARKEQRTSFERERRIST